MIKFNDFLFFNQKREKASSSLLSLFPFSYAAGRGYQRPVNSKRCEDFAKYLSMGEDALFTPILINASSNWEFTSYDSSRPSFGRLFCKGKASLMDGQHRMGGIQKYIQETNADISVPFLAFHSLDEDEEIKLFDTINTKAKGIGPSLSKFLRRDSDDISWVATELMLRRESPFLKELLPEDWADYKGSKLTHIVCIDALSMAGCNILTLCLHDSKRQIDYQAVLKHV